MYLTLIQRLIPFSHWYRGQRCTSASDAAVAAHPSEICSHRENKKAAFSTNTVAFSSGTTFSFPSCGGWNWDKKIAQSQMMMMENCWRVGQLCAAAWRLTHGGIVGTEPVAGFLHGSHGIQDGSETSTAAVTFWTPPGGRLGSSQCEQGMSFEAECIVNRLYSMGVSIYNKLSPQILVATPLWKFIKKGKSFSLVRLHLMFHHPWEFFALLLCSNRMIDANLQRMVPRVGMHVIWKPEQTPSLFGRTHFSN